MFLTIIYANIKDRTDIDKQKNVYTLQAWHNAYMHLISG